MKSPIDTAFVLAAGLGTRMRPLSLSRPKPLIELGGRPLVDHTIDRLSGAGITKIVVNVHYHANLLEAHLQRRRSPEIIISDERDKLMDTGGGVVKALPLIGDGPFIVANSDTAWIEGTLPALRRLMARFDPDQMDCLMLVAASVDSIGYESRGDFLMDEEGRLTRRGERPVAPFVYAGVFIAHPRLFAEAPSGAFSLNLLWSRAIENGRLFGLRHDGIWMHVGTPETLEEAEHTLQGATMVA